MNTNDVNEGSTGNDDTSDTGQTEQELLDAYMSKSPLLQDAGIVPLPDEEQVDVDPVDSVEEEDLETEEVVSEEVEEEVEEAGEEAVGEDDTSTQTDVFTTDDLDLDAKVSVKIDGKDADVSFGDLIKGYSTEQSLSKKGRELGEARKAIEAERNEKLSQLDSIAGAAVGVLSGAEQNFAKEYHDLDAKIKEARSAGDTYELADLKDQQEVVQKNYWNAKQHKDNMVKHHQQQTAAAQTEQWNKQVEHFQREIPNLIPDFSEKIAKDIRAFATEKGIPTSVLDNIADPAIVKFVDDYRRLEQSVSKGVAKRKAIPAKKAVPTKKAAPSSKKKADADKMTKARAFREGATQDDQMDFLRQYASRSLKL